MKQEDKVLSFLKNSNGYLTAKTARENGVSAATLKRMAGRGLIDRATRGLYIASDIIPDPFFVAQFRCPQGVFSHETALFFHNLSDRAPFQLMMTIPSGWNTRLLSSDDVIIFYCKAKYAQLGVAETATPYGHSVKAYDAPRTICDCLRSVDKLDKDLVLTALKRYMKDPSGNKAKLLEYAGLFKIRDIVMRYMEVLS